MKLKTIFDTALTLGAIAAVIFVILWLLGEGKGASGASGSGSGVQTGTSTAVEQIGSAAFDFWAGLVSGVDHLLGKTFGFSDQEIDQAENQPTGNVIAGVKSWIADQFSPNSPNDPSYDSTPNEANAQYWLDNPNGIPLDTATQDLLNTIGAG